MEIDTKIVSGLGAYFDAISKIECEINPNKVSPPVLWFRGMSDIRHSLIPSLYRTETRVEKNGKHDYSRLHYAEDIRTQHYIAKNYHFFQHEPSSRVEWLEVMQHHSMKTRVLDWSESGIHSLLFAIEPFLDTQKFNRKSRNECVPCVWILEPQMLNKKIFRYIREKVEQGEVRPLLDELQLTLREKYRIEKTFKKFGEFELYAESKETAHMDYILNLSVINDEILRDRSRIKYLLLSGDIIHPYYYILSRIYSDGHILKERELPPLAVVHPYHSERIKAQHGVFTVFPFYQENELDNEYRDIGLNPDAMENQKVAGSVLHRIILDNPQQIAYELMKSGMDNSWLYPEMPIVSNEIENHKIYN